MNCALTLVLPFALIPFLLFVRREMNMSRMNSDYFISTRCFEIPLPTSVHILLVNKLLYEKGQGLNSAGDLTGRSNSKQHVCTFSFFNS